MTQASVPAPSVKLTSFTAVHTLTLSSAALADKLAWLRRKRAALPKASIDVFLDQARFSCGPLEVGIPCKGYWYGTATFDGGLLRMVAKAPISSDTVEVRYQDGRIFVGNFSLPATWVDR